MGNERGFSGGLAGNEKNKGAALAFDTFGPNVAVVGFDGHFAKRETQSRACALMGFDLGKFFKNFLKVF